MVTGAIGATDVQGVLPSDRDGEVCSGRRGSVCLIAKAPALGCNGYTMCVVSRIAIY